MTAVASAESMNANDESAELDGGRDGICPRSGATHTTRARALRAAARQHRGCSPGRRAPSHLLAARACTTHGRAPLGVGEGAVFVFGCLRLCTLLGRPGRRCVRSPRRCAMPRRTRGAPDAVPAIGYQAKSIAPRGAEEGARRVACERAGALGWLQPTLRRAPHALPLLNGMRPSTGHGARRVCPRSIAGVTRADTSCCECSAQRVRRTRQTGAGVGFPCRAAPRRARRLEPLRR